MSEQQDLIDKYEEALKFYAYRLNHTVVTGQGWDRSTPMAKDLGEIAREALKT
jgi:hypothetical protein